jgi:fructose-bisphosphate aldolase class II
VIHINTELRVAWRKALEASLKKDESEVVPYKVLGEPLTAVQMVVRQRLELFNSKHLMQGQ